jgi:hypothetical protein
VELLQVSHKKKTKKISNPENESKTVNISSFRRHLFNCVTHNDTTIDDDTDNVTLTTCVKFEEEESITNSSIGI